MGRPAATRVLSPVLIVVFVAATTMVAATAVRTACLVRLVDRPGTEGWCGTQIPDLLITERLTQGRWPYLDACVPLPRETCDEYPVLTMVPMRLATVAGTDPLPYFLLSALVLSMAGVAAAWLLARRIGLRALYFAAAPALLLYGLMNWDLIGVAFAVWGITAFLSGRDTAAGIGIGLATATKLFPGLLLVGLVADRWRSGRRDGVARLLTSAGLTWLIVDLPFAVLAPGPWSHVFRFNSSRPPDIDALWYAACQHGFGEVPCMPTGLVNVLSLLLFAGAAVLVWRSALRRDPALPAWTLGLPLLALFFLANKVYSPQYDLWLLPWFALVLPHPVAFAVFSLAEIPVFLTRYADLSASPSLAFHAAVAVRDAALLFCVVAYVRGWSSSSRDAIATSTTPKVRDG